VQLDRLEQCFLLCHTYLNKHTKTQSVNMLPIPQRGSYCPAPPFLRK
jgi:hypothetical protein